MVQQELFLVPLSVSLAVNDRRERNNPTSSLSKLNYVIMPMAGQEKQMSVSFCRALRSSDDVALFEPMKNARVGKGVITIFYFC